MREVVAAADMVEVVSGRTSLRKCRCALHGPLPLPRGADAELLGQPGRQALPLLRLRQGRRRDHVRPRDREPRLRRRGRVAGRALPRDARVRGDAPRRSRRPRKRRERLHAVLDQAAAFYERHLWETAAGAPVARVPGEPRPRRGDLPRVPARPLAGSGARAQGAARSGFTGDELRAAGLRTRAATTTSRSG